MGSQTDIDHLMLCTRPGYTTRGLLLACARGRKVLHGTAGDLYEGPWLGRYYVLPNSPAQPPIAVCCPEQGAQVADVQWPKVRTQHGKLCLHSKKGEL